MIQNQRINYKDVDQIVEFGIMLVTLVSCSVIGAIQELMLSILINF